MTEADPCIGALVGDRYRVERLVGRGAFGAVYRALHERLDAPFAVKFLAANIAANPKLLARFEREAKTTCQLRHPHIVDVVDYGEDRRFGFYLAMEFLEGESLKQRLLRNGPLPQPFVRRLALQVGDALRVAHSRGVVHRDLKPANVMLIHDAHRRDHAKLCDFGVAGLTDASGPGLTATGMWIGTPTYMSPEQWEGRGIDARSDIYGFGIMLYEMLTGRVPFAADSTAKLLMMHAHDPPPPPRDVRPELAVHPLFESILLRCLEKDKAARFPSMDEVCDQLRMLPFREGDDHETSALRTRPGGEVAAASTVQAPTGVQHLTGERAPSVATAAGAPDLGSSPRRRLPLAVAAAVGLAAVVALVVLLTSGPARESGPAAPPRAASAPATAGAPDATGGAGGSAARSAAVATAPAGEVAGHPTAAATPVHAANDASATAADARETALTAADAVEAPIDRGADVAETEADIAETDVAATDTAKTGPTWSVRIDSRPRGASAWLDGAYLGRTPVDASLDATAASARLVLKKNGYERRTVTLDPARLAAEGAKETVEALVKEKEKDPWAPLREGP